MSLDMVHSDERKSGGKGKRFSKGKPHQERSDQTRPVRHRNTIDFFQSKSCRFKRFPRDGHNRFHVPS